MSAYKNRNIRTAISSVLISLAIYLIASFMLVMLIYEGLFAREEEYEYHSFLCYEDMNGYPVSDISFDSRGFELFGKIYGENKDSLVILCHGKGGTGEDLLAEARFFVDNGYSAMVFDLSGHGESGGNSQVGLYQPVYDLSNAMDFAEKTGYKSLYLYGTGTGGYAAALCSGDESVKAVAAVSAFESIPALTLEYATENMSIFGYLEYPVMLLYQYLVFGSDIYDSAAEALNNSGVPAIIINGTADDTILYDGSALINSASEITNPRVVLRTAENGKHSSLMRSEDANALLAEFNTEAYSLSESYGGNVPVSEIEALYGSYSREDMSELNRELMEEITAVFNSAG